MAAFKSLFRPRHYARLHQGKKLTHDIGLPPKGYVAVMAGHDEGEEYENERFLVPLAHLNHPLMRQFLVDAGEEFGCCYEGIIIIPCRACDFKKAMDVIVHGDGIGKKLMYCFL